MPDDVKQQGQTIDPKAFAAKTAPVDNAAEVKRREEFEAWQKKQSDDARAENERIVALNKARTDQEAADKAKADADAAANKAKDAADVGDKKAPPLDDKADRGKAAQKQKPPYEGEDVTYTPGKGDADVTTWRGIEFTAGKPVRIKEMGHIEAIRGNKFFRIGDGKSAVEMDKEPENAVEYRAHVYRWINGPGMTRIDNICNKWSSESELRKKCEVGADDIKMLGTLIEPKMKQMRMAEGLTDLQVGQLWVAHGTLELPWRAS